MYLKTSVNCYFSSVKKDFENVSWEVTKTFKHDFYLLHGSILSWMFNYLE